MGFARRPQELKKISDDNKDRKKCIYQGCKKIWDFDLDVRKTNTKISRMCNNTVQNEFFAIKTLTKWNPKKL